MGLLVVAAAGLALRLPELDVRPMHGDEAVHAFKLGELWESGVYRYDPNEFHGPTLYYATLPVLRLAGVPGFAEATETHYRLATVLFGAAMVLLLLLLADGLGWQATLWAGAFMAASPALVFYSRYYIQETLLTFFTLGLLGAGWRYARGRRLGWLLSAGAFAGLMVATKETAVISFLAAAFALALARVLGRVGEWESGRVGDRKSRDRGAAAGGSAPPTPPNPGGLRGADPRNDNTLRAGAAPVGPPEPGAVGSIGPDTPALQHSTTPSVHPLTPSPPHPLAARQAAAAVAVALAVACLFLSGFLSHPAGPLDYLRSYTPWLHRAGGTDLHQHPWHYYLSLLLFTHRGRGPVWTEGLILGLALVGAAFAWARPRLAGRPEPPRVRGGWGGQPACAPPDSAGQPACAPQNPAVRLEAPRVRGGWGGSPELLRFLSLYTLALVVAYSLIPYKTPWCVLSSLQGMVVLAGAGASSLVRVAPGRLLRGLVCLALAAGTAHLGWQAYQLATLYATDGRNPYVYAQTVPDVLDLAERIEGLARVSPARERMVVQVLAEDDYYWPIPWYLRRLPNIGYWTEVPETLAAPVILASDRYEKELARRLGPGYRMTGYYGLRPEVFFQVWVRNDLWRAYLKTRGG